jgi:hypothetical protein
LGRPNRPVSGSRWDAGHSLSGSWPGLTRPPPLFTERPNNSTEPPPLRFAKHPRWGRGSSTDPGQPTVE